MAEIEKFRQMAGRDLEIAKNLEEARKSLSERRYSDAMVQAAAVMSVSPEHSPVALEIMAQARQGLAQSSQRPAAAPRRGERFPGETVATVPESSDSAPTVSEAAPVRGETMAALNIHFKSDFPEDGSVIIYINGKEEHRAKFLDGKGGLLRRKEQQRLEFNKTLPVQAGFLDIRVQVAAGGRKADVVTRDGLFSGGASRSLDIRYGGPDQLSVTLR